MRAAIYARFSTDLQAESSIDDQIALCRTFAARERLTVVETWHDRAKSGASVFGRDGLMALMVAARARAFDVLLVEHTDRIARSMRDLADIHEKLSFWGITIRAVHSGAVMDTATIGLFGLVGQLQREDGAKKVRRGMAGVVRAGRHAGGRAYGYRPVPGRPGEMAIDPAEAAIIDRIFTAFLAGDSPRTIAHALNAAAVPPPRGRAWNASTINGSAQRRNGILHNDLYAGRIVWNKVRMVKDPETGRRVSRPNPAGEHQVAEAPHLAIVTEEAFAAAQKARADRVPGAPLVRRPKRLLSGLLRCGCCGAGMVVKDRDARNKGRTRVHCAGARESRTCTHGRTYYVDTIESLVVKGLRQELRDPRLIAEYVTAYREERRRLAGDATTRRIKLDTRSGEIAREIERLVDAIATGASPAIAVGGRLMALEQEQRDIAAERAALADQVEVVALHPAAVKRYLGQIEDLSATLASGVDMTSGSPAAAVRGLVESVVVHPVLPGAALDIEIRGYLAELTQDPRLAPKCRVSGFEVVAEEGLEPPTRGL